jgi:hypothetical protein
MTTNYVGFVHLMKWILLREPAKRPNVRQVLTYMENLVIPDRYPTVDHRLPVISLKVI